MSNRKKQNGLIICCALCAVLSVTGCAKDNYEKILSEYQEAGLQYAELMPKALAGDEKAKKEMEKLSERMKELNTRIEKLQQNASEEQQEELKNTMDSILDSFQK